MSNYVAKDGEWYNKIKKKFILPFFVVAMIVITGLLVRAISSDSSNNNTLQMERDVPVVQRFNYGTRQFERIRGTR